jgi:hypothetical protein
MIQTNPQHTAKTHYDSALPNYRTLCRSDKTFQEECKSFKTLCAVVRAAGRKPETLMNGPLHHLVFDARNCAGSVGKESLSSLARAGKVRKDLSNEDVRPVVADLLAFAAKGGSLTETEFADREAAFFAAVGGRAEAVFRRLVAVAFPAQASPVLSDRDLDALLRALVREGRAEMPADGTWLVRCRAIHDALHDEWTWPDGILRSVFARRLAAGVAEADQSETQPLPRPAVEIASTNRIPPIPLAG